MKSRYYLTFKVLVSELGGEMRKKYLAFLVLFIANQSYLVENLGAQPIDPDSYKNIAPKYSGTLSIESHTGDEQFFLTTEDSRRYNLDISRDVLARARRESGKVVEIRGNVKGNQLRVKTLVRSHQSHMYP